MRPRPAAFTRDRAADGQHGDRVRERVAGAGAVERSLRSGREDIVLLGAGLRVEPARQTVPKTSPRSSARSCRRRRCRTAAAAVRARRGGPATLRGPSFAAPIELTSRPNTPFNIPPLTVAGIHTLDNIRLMSGGEVLLRGDARERRHRGHREAAGHAGHRAAADRRGDPREGHRLRPVELPGLQLHRGVRDRATRNDHDQLPGRAAELQRRRGRRGQRRSTCRRSSAPALPSLQTIIPDTLQAADADSEPERRRASR